MALSNRMDSACSIAACACCMALQGCNKDTVRSDPHASSQARPSAKTNPETSASSARALSFDDAAITAAVTRQFMRDPGIDQAHLRVQTTDGIVQLTGTAGHLLSKERAVRLAENVRGVRAVSDRIDLQLKKRADADLQKDVETALRYNATTDEMAIEPSVSNSTVTLKGNVQSAVEKDIAERVVKRVQGVRAVDNELHIDYLAQRTDAEIQRDIESRLHWDAMVGGTFAVHVDGGHVRLIGETGSPAERTRAYWDARVTGVESVDISGVVIKPELGRRKSLATAAVAMSDADLASRHTSTRSGSDSTAPTRAGVGTVSAWA